jgi:hypothetical protein
MAGQSAKKLGKTRESRMFYFRSISVLVFVLFFVSAWYREAGIPFFRAALFGTLLAISVSMIDAALAQAVDYELWQDLFFVTALAAGLSALWAPAIWLLVLIPGYGVYVWGGQGLQALAQIGKNVEPEPQPNIKKRK